MKLSILIVSLFCNILLAFSQGQIVDKIIAQVGGNVVLLSDIQARKKQMSEMKGYDETKAECSILERLMYQNLLVNQAKIDSVEVTDEQVTAEIETRLRVIIQQIGSKEALEKFYGKTISGIKEEFRPAIKKRLLAQEMERQITQDIIISPKEIEQFYNDLPEDSIPYINAEIRLQQIAIFPEITELDKQRASDKLKKIRDEILANKKTFKTMAALYSEDPGSRSKGGEITATRGQMVPEFEAAVFSLKPGEISNVFESTYGFHIVKLVERRGDDYTCRHILVIPNASEKELMETSVRIEECYNKLKKNEITWDDAVLKYSNDASTKWNKGNLTNPRNGTQFWDAENLNQIDPQMYILVSSLEPGGVSRPSVYDDFAHQKKGFRIVRMAERTQPHKASLKDDYQLVQSAALSLKKQNVIKEWVNKKIDNAYCRIDEEFKDCEFQYNWFNKK